MNRMLLSVLILLCIISAESFAMQKRPLEEEASAEYSSKRRKTSTTNVEAKQEFDEYQMKVKYFYDFRQRMERKFSHWGSSLQGILDKLAVLYLDKASDRPGVFVIGSTPGAGKNTLVKHIRDFLEEDPFADKDLAASRFQLIKDKSKKVFEQDTLRSTGSSERLKKGIHRVVVIDEIQSMSKDYYYNIANEQWFHALGDAEYNVNIEGFITNKRGSVCHAIKTYFSYKIQLNSLEQEMSALSGETEASKVQAAMPIIEKKLEDLKRAMSLVLNSVAVELNEVKNEVPEFFKGDEFEKSPEKLALDFLNSDPAMIERRFTSMPPHKHLNFARNIYIFLGNPVKLNDEIFEENSRAQDKSRDALRCLAKKKLTEAAIREWFFSCALSQQNYVSNKSAWDSRISELCPICPPADKHMASLIAASIESDYCSSDAKIIVDEASLAFFSAQLEDSTKDLRSLSRCYAPILTRMFTDMDRQRNYEQAPIFLLEKHGNELELKLETDNKIKVVHRIKTKKPKNKPPESKVMLPPPQPDLTNKKFSLYSSYFYMFYAHMFTKLPTELHRLDETKFNEFYDEQIHEFSLDRELKLLLLEFVLKFVGMKEYPGEIDPVFKKDRAVNIIKRIVNYFVLLKKTHRKEEIDFIIIETLKKLDHNLAVFLFKSGFFEEIKRVIIAPPSAMSIDSDQQQDIGTKVERISDDDLADMLYDVIISWDHGTPAINATIELLAHQIMPLGQKNFEQAFAQAKKLIVTTDIYGNTTISPSPMQ